MDVTKAPFNDVHVRRAVAYSVDRAGIAKAAFGSFATLMTGLVPVAELGAMAGSQATAAAFLSGLPQYPLSETAAKAELAQSAPRRSSPRPVRTRRDGQPPRRSSPPSRIRSRMSRC